MGAGLGSSQPGSNAVRATEAEEALVPRQADEVAACGQAAGQATRPGSPGTHPQHSVLPVPLSIPQVWWMPQLTCRNCSAGLTGSGTGVSKKAGASPPPGTSPAGRAGVQPGEARWRSGWVLGGWLACWRSQQARSIPGRQARTRGRQAGTDARRDVTHTPAL